MGNNYRGEGRMSGLGFESIVTSLASAASIAKALVSAERTFDKAELKLKLADLMVALADARTQVAEMQDQTYRIADELSETKKKLAFSGSMQYEAPYYWNVAGGKRDGPYCATCWEGRDHLAIHLYEWSRDSWACNTCKSSVKDAR